VAVTTIQEIRLTLTAVVQFLTPLERTQYGFSGVTPIFYYTLLPENTFRGWAEANASACFRSFAMEEGEVFENVGIQDGDKVRKRGQMLLTMAYPNAHAAYTGEQADLMQLDMNQIEAAIGIHGLANWPAGSVAINTTQRYERGESVRFSVLDIEFEYCYQT
jgi:hypothetical protein